MANSLIHNVFTCFGFFTLGQDEIGVKLTFGKYSSAVASGLGFCFPMIQRVVKTKASLMSVDLPVQKVILPGEHVIAVSGSLSFRVVNPKKAILEVENYTHALTQMAKACIEEVLGAHGLEDIIANKQALVDEMENGISQNASRFGLGDVALNLFDTHFDSDWQKAHAQRLAFAEKAKAARSQVQLDKELAGDFNEVAQLLAQTPGAMTLKVLHSLGDLSNSNTQVVVPMPSETPPFSGKKSPGKHKQQTTMPFTWPQNTEASIQKNPLDDEHEELSEQRDWQSPDRPDDDTREIEVHKQDQGSMIYPTSEVFSEEGEQKANCPHCGAKYNVSDILNTANQEMSELAVKQQVKCKLCKTIFALDIDS